MIVQPVLCGLVAAALLVGVTLAQEQPKFAGRWMLAGAGSRPAQPLIVSETDESLTVENWSGSGPSPGTHPWVTDSPQTAAAAPTVSWNGATLVIVFPAATWPAAPGVLTVRTESWSLDTTGKLTVVIDYAPPQGPRTVERFLYTRLESR